jgi:hypothetical protein
MTSLAKFVLSGKSREVPTLKLVAIQIHLEPQIYVCEASRRGWVVSV